jgi:DNA-binding response OmpR family regulator
MHAPLATAPATATAAKPIAEAIVLPWRGAAVAAAEPRVLLLAAGETPAAEAWGRGLAAECLHGGDRGRRGQGATATIAAMQALGRDDEAESAQEMRAVALHVADALAPHLAELRALRARWPQLPLVVVVRGLRDLDQVLALEMGADDVLDALAAAPVVAARLRALWRRAAAAGTGNAEREPPRELRFGALRLLRLEREVRLADATVPLTEGEFEVLWLLASHAGQAMSRRDILKRVRGLDDQPLDRSIDSRVYRIRAKLGDSQASPPRIRTVRHQGYAFSPTGW